MNRTREPGLEADSLATLRCTALKTDHGPLSRHQLVHKPKDILVVEWSLLGRPMCFRGMRCGCGLL